MPWLREEWLNKRKEQWILSLLSYISAVAGLMCWEGWPNSLLFTSVQFSCSVVSDSLWPHGLQHTRPPCPSPAPGACSNSCPSSLWCHPTISSSVVPFSSHLQSFPASGSFPVSYFLSSDGQSIGVSASASVLPVNSQDWSPLGWTGWISLQSKGLSRVFPTAQLNSINSSALSFLHSPTHIHTWLVGKVMSAFW